MVTGGLQARASVLYYILKMHSETTAGCCERERKTCGLFCKFYCTDADEVMSPAAVIVSA